MRGSTLAALGGSPAHGDAIRAGNALVQLLVGIDAPQALLLDPAVETVAHDPAPGTGASLHQAEHADLEPRQGGALRVRLVVEREQLVLVLVAGRDRRGAPAGQHRMIHPALGAFPIADAAPVLELGCD